MASFCDDLSELSSTTRLLREERGGVSCGTVTWDTAERIEGETSRTGADTGHRNKHDHAHHAHKRSTTKHTTTDRVYTVPRSSNSAFPGDREWTRVGDFITGTGGRSHNHTAQGLWSALRSGTTNRRRRHPLMPEHGPDEFMESQYVVPSAPGLSQDDSIDINNSTHLSSHLPHRVWIILTKCLGIRRSRDDKPFVGMTFHTVTVLAALTFAVPGIWFTVQDIKSKLSSTTVLIGCFQIILGFAWSILGIYSHRLAGRLFSNKNFVECVRLHSKTFLKINISWLTLFLGAVALCANCYTAWSGYLQGNCGNAQVESIICLTFLIGRLVYAVITLAWNFLVAYVLFSVCRTHTIGIRRFMQLLMLDAWIYENRMNQQQTRDETTINQTDLEELDQQGLDESWCVWDGDSDEEPVKLTNLNSPPSTANLLQSMRRHSGSNQMLGSRVSMEADTEDFDDGDGSFDLRPPVAEGQRRRPRAGTIGGVAEDGSAEVTRDDSGDDDMNVHVLHPSINTDPAEGSGGGDTDGGNESKNEAADKETLEDDLSMLTNDELLMNYWKFNRRLCVTSRFLQRWLASWVAFILMWDGYFIVYWTSHTASLPGILQFTIPLLILLLVCSAYSEVNAESQRLLRTICPLQERLDIIYYFSQQPLTIRVFSFTVTYNSMMTVILGFSVAFASRMILDEISRH